MEKIRVLNDQELKFVTTHLKSIRGLADSLLQLLDPIEAGLDETPSIPKAAIARDEDPQIGDKNATNVETLNRVQHSSCRCGNKD